MDVEYFGRMKKRMRPSAKLQEAWMFRQPPEQPVLGAASLGLPLVADAASDSDDDVPLMQVLGQWVLVAIAFFAAVLVGTGDKADDLFLLLWSDGTWSLSSGEEFAEENPAAMPMLDA